MRYPRRLAGLASCLPLAAALLGGCGGMSSNAARAQEAAQELNLNTRFGRIELVVEHVAAKARDEFLQRHKGWGSGVRIADSELSGFRMTTDSDAEISVRIAWYRPDEGDLHVTQLRQKWHDQKGTWLLTAEDRTDGDLGLLGEHVATAPVEVAKRPAQFPTIRIGSAEESN